MEFVFQAGTDNQVQETYSLDFVIPCMLTKNELNWYMDPDTGNDATTYVQIREYATDYVAWTLEMHEINRHTGVFLESMDASCPLIVD